MAAIDDFYINGKITSSGLLSGYGGVLAANFLCRGGVRLPYASITTTYNIGVNDYTLDCSGTFAVTLPNASTVAGQIYNIKNSGSGVITLNTTSSQLIDGQASGYWTLAAKDCVQLQSTGTAWIRIG